jgi:hypothetical protein
MSYGSWAVIIKFDKSRCPLHERRMSWVCRERYNSSQDTACPLNSRSQDTENGRRLVPSGRKLVARRAHDLAGKSSGDGGVLKAYEDMDNSSARYEQA